MVRSGNSVIWFDSSPKLRFHVPDSKGKTKCHKLSLIFILNLKKIVGSNPNANYLVSFLTRLFPLYPSICWGGSNCLYTNYLFIVYLPFAIHLSLLLIYHLMFLGDKIVRLYPKLNTMLILCHYLFIKDITITWLNYFL